MLYRKTRRQIISILLVAFLVLVFLSFLTVFVKVGYYGWIVYGSAMVTLVLLLFFLSRKKGLRIISSISETIFKILLFLYIVLLFVNEFKPVEFFNLNYLLIAVLVFGFLVILLPGKKMDEKVKLWQLVLVSVVGGAFIFLKVIQLGWLAYLIGVVSALLIGMLSYMITDENRQKSNVTD